jgi:hypothetical protein
MPDTILVEIGSVASEEKIKKLIIIFIQFKFGHILA